MLVNQAVPAARVAHSLYLTPACGADTINTGETNYMLQPVKLLVLAPGQEIKLRAIARKGVGKDHAKWMPVATAVLSRVPDIRINEALMNTLSDEQKQEFVDSCPQKVFRISPVTNAVRFDFMR